jgi:hypothetical protein
MMNKKRRINRAFNCYIEPTSTAADRVKNERIVMCQMARQRKRRATA